jgi:hypothetical protein
LNYIFSGLTNHLGTYKKSKGDESDEEVPEGEEFYCSVHTAIAEAFEYNTEGIPSGEDLRNYVAEGVVDEFLGRLAFVKTQGLREHVLHMWVRNYIHLWPVYYDAF